MNLPSSSSSRLSSLHIFDDQTAEAAVALLQIRGSPRTPHTPFTSDLSHSFTSTSPVSVAANYFSGLNSTHYDQRYYAHTETNNPGHLYLSHPTESVPFSVPIINAPSPQLKRKRSVGAESIRMDSQPPMTDKGKAVDYILPTEGAVKTLENDGVVRCICEIQVDDGFTIQCESCQVWQHAACMRIHPKSVPQVYLCERCNPRLVDGVRARRALLSRLQAKANQKQAQERKKQSRRTSSEGTSKRGKDTASASPQPPNSQPSPQRKSSTLLASPIQQYSFPPPDSRYSYLHHSSVVAKDEVISPVTPLVPITDSSTSTPSTFYNPLPVRQSNQSLHILRPRIDSLETPCHIRSSSSEVHVKCDHAIPPIISLHSDTDGDGHWTQYRVTPSAVLRPFICGKTPGSSDGVSVATFASAFQEDVQYIVRNGISDIKLGVFALRDIKAGDEIVLGCEWKGNILNSLRSQNEPNTNTMSTTLSNFTFCGCGCSTEPCIRSQYSTLSFDTKTPNPVVSNQNVPPETRVKKKPKTTTKERPRKPSTTNATLTKERKAPVNGKSKTTKRKKEMNEMDMDQDVDIDTKSEDLPPNPLEFSTNALASLSIRGSPELLDHTDHTSHLESVVEAALKLSTIQEQRSENNDPGVSLIKIRPSRASSISHSLLEPVGHSPRLSSVKLASTPTVSPLLPSSAANANLVLHVLDSVVTDSAESTNLAASLPSPEKEPQIAEDKNRPPIKRLSLADWKISKDKEKQALKEAQGKTIKGNATERNMGTSTKQTVTDAIGSGEDTGETHTMDTDEQLVSIGIQSLIRADEKASVMTPSVKGSDMDVLSHKGMMEAGIINLDVDTSDEYSTEARQFTSPQVPSCSLQADNGSDPQHTPVSMPDSVVDDANALNRRSPYESCFEEGEIKSSPPLPSTDPPPSQVSHPPFCSPTQTPRPSGSISPSRSPPTHPRSYHPRPPRSTSPFSSHGRPKFDGPQRNFSRPVPSAPRALRGGPPPRHPSSFSSSYRPNNHRSGLSRDYDRYRGPPSSTSTQRSRDSSPHGDSSRPWRDPPWKR